LDLPEHFTLDQVRSAISEQFVKELTQAHETSKTATITTHKEFHTKGTNA
jgi:hypothetical protein